MATILNTVVCDDEVGNTGIPNCAFDPKLIRSGFLAPLNFEIPSSALATEQTLYDFLSDAVTNPPATRVYPLPKFKAITDNTADVTTQTSGYGDIAFARTSPNDWTFELLNGSVCVNNQLLKFNDTTHGFLFLDEEGSLLATKNATGDGLKPIPRNALYVYNWKAADGTNPTIYRMRFVYDGKYVNKLVGFAKVETLDLSEIPGILNVVVSVVSRAANVVNVTAKTSCGNTDLHDLFATQLAVTTNWNAVSTLNGNDVSITSVASTSTGWALTLNASDPDYNTTASGMSVGLAPAATLAGAGLVNYESKKTLIPAP